MLLSRGARRAPLAGAAEAPTVTTPPSTLHLQRRPIVNVITITVDARGQSCPGPLVGLARAIKGAGRGDLLELLATDPGSKSDVPAWSKLTGNELVETSEQDGIFRYVVRKA
jgi:tRNA 2-thiouridine synthesizing protein A